LTAEGRFIFRDGFVFGLLLVDRNHPANFFFIPSFWQFALFQVLFFFLRFL
jgi:hypothetical protein